MKVLIDSIPKVQKFCKITNGLRYEVDVTSGRHIVNGKSLLGLFSLNLSNPVTVRVHESDEEIAESVFYEFKVEE